MKKGLVAACAAIGWTIAAVACSSNPPAMPDASTDDGGMDDVEMDVQPDKAIVDTGVGDVKLTCPNPKSDLTGFVAPTMVVPPHPPQDACNPAQLGSYWSACQGMGSTPAMCNAWRGANQTCAQCLESNDTDSSWGVLVYGSGKYIPVGVTEANFDGCLVLEGATQCANDDFALGQCEVFACQAQCPVTDNPSYLAYNSCTQTAQSGVCKSYYAKLPVDCTGDSGPAVTTCRGMNFQDYFTKIAPIMCAAGG